ncbi:hypothetical protein [Streptomyces sp. NPDC001401]|uniref:hypothetical protein n=1 Tax=Streptomyces sp. NPDC001401 TaxID=3364570 RepID=UPI00369F064B
MNGEMITAVTALVVAVLGALTSVYVTSVTMREQRILKQSEAELQRELQSVQNAAERDRQWLQAEGDARSSASTYLGICWELAQELGSASRTAARCEDLYAIYSQRWEEVKRAFVTVSQYAPTPEASEKAAELDAALGKLGDLMASWFHELKKENWQGVRAKWSGFTTLKDAGYQAYGEFTEAVEQARGVA